jgi:hypothetical protein
MARQLPNELLPDHPRGAENADIDSLRLHLGFLRKNKKPAALVGRRVLWSLDVSLITLTHTHRRLVDALDALSTNRRGRRARHGHGAPQYTQPKG